MTLAQFKIKEQAALLTTDDQTNHEKHLQRKNRACEHKGRKEMFYLTTHSTYFNYGYTYGKGPLR